MKKTLTIITLLAGAIGLHAQGYLNWMSYVPDSFAITIWSVDPANPYQQLVGDGPNDIPSGTQSYGTAVNLGGLATGTGSTGLPSSAGTYNGNLWTVGLYVDTSAAAVSADVKGGSPIATSLMTSSTGTDNQSGGNAGYWGVNSMGELLLLPVRTSFAHSAVVYVELASWYNGAGATSYATAIADGVPAGTDTPGIITLNSVTSTPPTLAGTGLESFDMVAPVPEPGMIALAGIGASAFLFRRRK